MNWNWLNNILGFSSRTIVETTPPEDNLYSPTNGVHYDYIDDVDFIKKTVNQNPILYSVLDKRARAFGNRKLELIDINTGRLISWNSDRKIVKKVANLLAKPSPSVVGATFEYLRSFNYDAYGNSFIYMNYPVGFPQTFEYLSTIVNLRTEDIVPELTGKWETAVKMSDIVSGYKNTRTKANYSTDEILWQSQPSIGNDDSNIFGVSKIFGLRVQLDNIMEAYKARGNVIVNRGAELIISSNKGDANGKVALSNKEKKVLIDAYNRDYGVASGKSPTMFSPIPINVDRNESDVRKMGLFDEVESDALAVCNQFGVNPDLIRYSASETSFNNQEASLKQFYQDTIIPESAVKDQILNDGLKLANEGVLVLSSYSHVPVLQKSEKDAAAAVNYYSKAYMPLLIGEYNLSEAQVYDIFNKLNIPKYEE